jgi:Fe-S-cluster containining protein
MEKEAEGKRLLEWIIIGELKVDSRVLESWPVTHCRIEECQALCCSHGVYVDLADASRIVEEAELIKPHLREENRDVDNWFDGGVGEDADFPSGHRVGTQVVPEDGKLDGTTCVFLTRDNRCGLQVASIAARRHKWDLKPFYCALYPLILIGDRIQLDDDNSLYQNNATCHRTPSVPVPLYLTLKEELTLGLGQEGYDQLCFIARGNAGQNK